MAYYYLEQIRYQNQLADKQQLLNELTQNYDTATTKRNLLSGEYGVLFGEYQWFVYKNWFTGENCSLCMGEFEKLLSNLRGNYTSTLDEFPELNTTYNNLLDEFQRLNEQSQVTKEEFGSLLDDFYKLFTALMTKELEGLAEKATVIYVNLCIDYGNQTIKWYNNTSTSLGTTLFDLTRNITDVEYSYWPTMEPGHILITSINNYAQGYWIWYYWDDVKNEWIFGPVGCDAWVLSDHGIYKWVCGS